MSWSDAPTTSVLHFQPSSFPFVYLGLQIGANMNKAGNWKPIIEKFRKRLTAWKARSLSYDGRLTLIKSVLGALGTYYFSLFKAPKNVICYLEKLRRNFFWGGAIDSNNKLAWIAWKRVCSLKSRGGLGIGSLFSSNLAMLTKWWWRFYSESSSLWKLIVVSIHGNDGKIGPHYPSSSLPSCPWKNITQLNKHLSRLDISLHSIFSRKVGDGSTFKFWNDHWVGESCLKSAYPRLFYLDNNKECRIRDRVGSSSDHNVYFWDWRRPIRDGRDRTQLNELLNVLSNVALTASPDAWIFNSTDSMSFSTSDMRYIIDSSFLYSSGVSIRWNKNLPIKINIHSWRLSLNRLPTRFNLDKRGVDLNTFRCPVCDGDIETDLHVFVKCPIAVSIWSSISRWWNIGDFPKDINGLIKWSDTLTLTKHTKICLDVVIQTSLWIIWRYRNNICFDLKPTRKDTLMEEIMILSHSWILNRNRSVRPSWLEWISDPKIACTIKL